MSPITICNIIGWITLIASWTVGFFITNKRKSRDISIVLSAFALGIFIANGIHIFND